MKSFVITLVSLPDSVAAANRCIESGKVRGLSVQMSPAFNPQEHKPISILKEEGIPGIGFSERWSRHNNVICCFLSHYHLWKDCAAGTDDYLILEHDAVFINNIPSAQFKGVLSLGQPSYGSYVTPPMIGVNKLVSKQYFPGAHAYIVTPKAAKKLVERAKIDACPVDVFLHNDRFDFLEEFYPWPVEARDSFTTVQNTDGCLAKHNYKKNRDAYKIL